MKSIFQMNEKELEYNRLINEANEAKERLARLAEKLIEAGFIRKGKSLLTLAYKVEEWQQK